MSEEINCVLLVDDEGAANFANYRIVKSLQLTGNIQIVYQGEKALDFIKEYGRSNENNAPELILLDMKMPGMDGFEFWEEFKNFSFKNTDKIQIVILSNFIRPSDIEKMKTLGLLYFVEKPLTKEKLLKVMNRSIPGAEGSGA